MAVALHATGSLQIGYDKTCNASKTPLCDVLESGHNLVECAFGHVSSTRFRRHHIRAAQFPGPEHWPRRLGVAHEHVAGVLEFPMMRDGFRPDRAQAERQIAGAAQFRHLRSLRMVSCPSALAAHCSLSSIEASNSPL